MILNKVHTRKEVMDDALWLILLVAVLQWQLALVIAILAKAFTPESIFFVGSGLFFLLLAVIPGYWGRFVALVLWTGVLGFDFYLRSNPFSLFFILFGFVLLYRIIRFRKSVKP